ncbi:LPS export ABC transporter periplasmic protein LptC [Undibacterium sp. SXout7W]|uniref:LPS export ABC transporter periplasmic protein LptC n=1 Tax=Undibacterium sp. SXout7W TaxID=3413049 RepID=UPI003BF0EC9B
MKPLLTADRFRIWLGVVLLAVVALGSFWMMEVLRRSGEDEQNKSSVRSEPDYYVEKFNFIRLSNSNNPNYHITGDRLIHLPKSDSFEILQPRINSFDEEKTPVHIRADKAVIEEKNAEITPQREHDVVHLYDNVSMERPESPNSHYLQLQTDYLMLLPDDDIIKTDKAVNILTANAETNAIGMLANNATQQMQLMSKVRVRLKKSGKALIPQHSRE